MKVIVASFPKCGTKTIASALKELGYDVCDGIDHYELHYKEWMQLFYEGATTEDFREMYENIDACSDVPACFFWEEIHKAFPQSKIIFTQRKSEHEWWASMLRQIQSGDGIKFRLMGLLCPTYRSILKFSKCMGNVVCGFGVERPVFGKYKFNELLWRMSYRRHNEYLLSRAPRDKLLVLELDQGWKPLCEFLQVPVPNVPFPHENKNARLVKDMMKSHPTFQRIKKELLISSAIVVCVLSITLYYFLF